MSDDNNRIDSDSTIVTTISSVFPSKNTGDACFVVISGRELGKKFNLARSTSLVGRSPKTDIQLDEDAVSRNHALIVNEGTRILVRDLGSTNGTYVNDIQLEKKQDQTLIEGDQVKIGRTIFKFLSGNNIEHTYHEEIYRLTTTDGLTQIYNKRYFLETLEREMSRSLRYERNLALILLDLDHFKGVNDTYGHLAGDFVLKQVAQHLKRNIRRDDVIARYGGEEFVIVCPEVNKLQAAQLAEKLRDLVERKEFRFDGVCIPITVSMGVSDLDEYLADHPANAETLEPFDLVKLADRRLYEAKHLGRNRVVS